MSLFHAVALPSWKLYCFQLYIFAIWYVCHSPITLALYLSIVRYLSAAYRYAYAYYLVLQVLPSVCID